MFDVAEGKKICTFYNISAFLYLVSIKKEATGKK